MVEVEREILTLREASEFLNCHPSTVYRLVKSSQIPAFRLGGSWRFVKPELHRWIRGLTEWPGHDNDQPAGLDERFAPKMAKPSPPSHRQENRTSAAGAAKGRHMGRH